MLLSLFSNFKGVSQAALPFATKIFLNSAGKKFKKFYEKYKTPGGQRIPESNRLLLSSRCSADLGSMLRLVWVGYS